MPQTDNYFVSSCGVCHCAIPSFNPEACLACPSNPRNQNHLTGAVVTTSGDSLGWKTYEPPLDPAMIVMRKYIDSIVIDSILNTPRQCNPHGFNQDPEMRNP